MRKVRKQLRWFPVFLIPVLIILLLFAAKDKFRFPNDQWKALETLLQKKETIIDGVWDGTRAYVIINKEGRTDYGDYLVVFEQDGDAAWKRVYENDFTGLKPWKIEVSDIDGDGINEILTAVRKTTHFDQEEKNRLFIFNYEAGKLVKKWTGSQAAGLWEDFTAGDLLPIKGNELIFIEQAAEKKEKLSIYYWFDFGFIKLTESNTYRDIQKLSIIGENRIQITYDKGRTAVLSVQKGELTQENEIKRE